MTIVFRSIAHALIATPESDAALRVQYNALGDAAYRTGQPRIPPCDPASMIGDWWHEGFDLACRADNVTKSGLQELED